MILLKGDLRELNKKKRKGGDSRLFVWERNLKCTVNGIIVPNICFHIMLKYFIDLWIIREQFAISFVQEKKDADKRTNNYSGSSAVCSLFHMVFFT